jgi:hypothetical protein
MLQYVYGGVEELFTPDNAVDLLQAADRFMMDDLKQIVEAYIQQSVDTENAAWLVEISDRYGAHRLKRICMELMCESNKENFEEIRKTVAFADLRTSSPHLLREIDFRASKSNLIACGELLRSIVAHGKREVY